MYAQLIPAVEGPGSRVGGFQVTSQLGRVSHNHALGIQSTQNLFELSNALVGWGGSRVKASPDRRVGFVDDVGLGGARVEKPPAIQGLGCRV